VAPTSNPRRGGSRAGDDGTRPANPRRGGSRAGDDGTRPANPRRGGSRAGDDGTRRPAGVSVSRTILHVDLDAFFAAVEQRDRPELRGKPVVVGIGGPNDRGVVSAASYEARRFGVHSALPIRTAKRLCPDCIFVPVDGRKYAAVSREVMAILRRFTPLVEPISIDEAFMDVTASRALFGAGETIAGHIKDAIRDELGLTASVGVATTKLVAKIASDLRKPDGLVVVPPGQEAAFLAPLPISRLWGVGPSTVAALRDFGVATIGDLAGLDRAALSRRLGRHGAALVDRAHGRDSDAVGGTEVAKSIGHEHTFDEDTSDRDAIERTLLAMADGVSARLRDAGARASTVTVKIRDSTFVTITRQRRLPEPTDLTEPIWRAALELARPELRGKRIRLVGVTASGLAERAQLALFDGLADDRRRRAVRAADDLRHRFGTRAVTRARLIRAGLPSPFEHDLGTPVERRGRFDNRPGTGRREARRQMPPPASDEIDEVPTDEVPTDEVPTDEAPTDEVPNALDALDDDRALDDSTS
jgi:DNA polymerase-4